jgi:hypothetical protein
VLCDVSKNMELDHVEVHASPHFMRASCPKGHGDMLELPNGWFSVCWYCEKCGYPYHLVMMKMKVVNEKNLKEVLAEARAEQEAKRAKRK